MISLMILIVVLSYFPCSLVSVLTQDLDKDGLNIKCFSHVECLNISDESYCENGICSCNNNNQFDVQRGCYKLFGLLQDCELSENCSAIENSYCSSKKKCECLTNYDISIDRRSCVKKIISEMVCVSDHECHEIIPNARCDNVNSCFCESGIYDGHECYLDTANISKCHNSLECTRVFHGSQCVDGRCSCPENFIQINDSYCQPRNLEKCFDNATCHTMDPFSFCSDKNSCECSSGYHPSDLVVCTKRKLGDTCQLNNDCEDAIKNSFCNQDFCKCKLGFRQGPRLSCVQIQIGDVCNQDEECNTSIKNSYCHGNLSSCHCNSGFVENDFSLICNKLQIGRGECMNSGECLDAVSDSYCSEDLVCLCISGYGVSESLDACIRRKIGDRNCLVRSDCSDSISNGNCSVEGQCICDDGFYPNKSDNYVCIRRVLGDESHCTTDIECTSVINKSHCFNNSCQCMLGFIGHDDNQHCRPRILADDCNFDEDCNTAMPSSYCQHQNLCACLSGFAEVDNSTCQKRKIGDQNCETDSDCYDAVKDSLCQRVSMRNLLDLGIKENVTEDEMKTCLCRLGFYEQNNGTTCTLRQIGDLCSIDKDCSYAVGFSICDEKLLNCTCDYDHMVIPPDMSNCVDRPVIDQYKSDRVLKSFRKTYGCGRVFQYHKHTQQCPMAITCTEGGKMRDIYRKQPHCQRSSAYVLRFNCTLIVGKYELVPLKYSASYVYNKTSDSYWENALRLSFYGVDQIMQEMNSSSLTKSTFHNVANRYFTSRILHFEPIKEGIQAIIGIFFKLDKNSSEVDMETINNMILQYLERSDGQIGLSKIYLSEPYNENFYIEDYDECETNSSFPAVLDSNIERNDCNQNAICANIQGFYQCVCDTSFVDKLEDIEFPGRTCTYKSDALEVELLLSQKECTEDNKCETPWSFVIFVTTIIFGLLFLLLAFETVWRMKQMSHSLDEKCRRQTAQLEMKLTLLREQRRRNINRLLGRPVVVDGDEDRQKHEEVTQIETHA